MELNLSTATITQINRGKKRKLNIDKWERHVRKARKDAGKSYISSRKVPKPAVLPPEEVSNLTYIFRIHQT